MMIIKCKMCGGDIDFIQGATYGTCEYCGSTSTIPKAEDEGKLNRYNRANHFRRQGEFDKAAAAYEKILEQDDTDAEAHWGAVISRYGIEYVEDPATGKRVPTCHRLQLASILSDEDYKAAVEYAPDEESRQIYREEGARIAEIQKGILAISQNEKPYDVFICYKETDENGQRTHDSQWAQDVYYGLTEQGYKVFFSRITLEDKLGQEYEPYIFAALNSAKVMVVIGSKPEYFNAVWVRNEWSRYLKLMANDRGRLLIPCYRGMDPYDLPDELSSLQSQDMGKIGFMQDLIRGVKKVLESEKKAINAETEYVAVPAISESANVTALLGRAFLALEDKDFDRADDFAERALNMDYQSARAYLVKLMVERKVRRTENLLQEKEPFDSSSNYQKALRFANPEMRSQLQGWNRVILDRIEAARCAEEEHKRRIAETERMVQTIEKQFYEQMEQYRLACKPVRSYKKSIEKETLALKDAEKRIVILRYQLSQLKGLFGKNKRLELEQQIEKNKREVQNHKTQIAHLQSEMEKVAQSLPEPPSEREKKYQIGICYMQVGLYKKAYQCLLEIKDYKDVDNLLVNCQNLSEKS